MAHLHEFIKIANELLWEHILIFLLIGTGAFFTLRTGCVQVRLLKRAWQEMMSGRQAQDHNDITPFQAFATGLASRVGTGNIAGIAIAINMGGPGAVFWMWVTAILGMSSAFAESTLAQLFKKPHHDNTFRGGPAYYIQKGLGKRWLGVLFALCLILAFGLVFNAVQANSIVAATQSAWGWRPEWVGLGLVLLSAPIICGGVKSVAKVAEWLVPLMAGIYLLLAFYIVVTNLHQLPGLFVLIVKSAFGLEQAAGGFVGYAASQALTIGIKRGLFSNEAGMGSAPNAAATATTKHPVNQGLIQVLGVGIDTMFICTATALIILLSDIGPTKLNGVQLTQKALEMHFGVFGGYFLAVAIFLFAFSSIIGNYAYAEGNVEFIKKNKAILYIFRLMVLGMVFFGSIGSLPLVWDMADLSMGLMATINLIAILLLSRYVIVLQKDYEKQLKAGDNNPTFDAKHYPEIASKIYKDTW